MKIRIVGHNMKYEAECITMLFFPDEKIVTTEYPADTEFPEQDEEDFIEARQQRGLMKVTLHLNGRETSLCRTVLSNPRTPYEEAEYIMSDMMFTLLCEATGTHPAWGSMGRTDLYGGDDAEMFRSLKRLGSLQGYYKVFPGHGSATNLDDEKLANPFLRRAIAMA